MSASSKIKKLGDVGGLPSEMTATQELTKPPRGDSEELNSSLANGACSGELPAVLIIGFKRIESLRRVIDATFRVPQGKIYVALDGPRSPADMADCNAVRNLVRSLAEHIPITVLAAEQNLGCGIRIETAVTKVLDEHEEVVVLEDDCVPSLEFFTFCRSMLVALRHDQRIMHVSGNRFFASQTARAGEVTFSKYPHAWGWATWRRAWKLYSRDASTISEDVSHGLVESFCPDPDERRYWSEIVNDLACGRADIWDYYWMLSIWRQGGIAVLPPKNLVTNVGFDRFATHTSAGSSHFSIPSEGDVLGAVTVPTHRRRDRQVERTTFLRNLYSGDPPDTRPIWKRAIRRLREALVALESS